MSTIKKDNLSKEFVNIESFIHQSEDNDSIQLLTKFIELVRDSSENLFVKNAAVTSELFDILLNETGGDIYTVISGICISYFKPELNDLDDIEKNFGSAVRKIILSIIKLPDIKIDKLDKQSDKYIKLLLSLTEDVRAILVLLAFQIFDIRHSENYSSEKQDRIINQVNVLYIPLAHRVGLYNIKTELEERVMKYTEPDMYRFIAQKLKDTKANRDKYINLFIEPLRNLLIKSGYTASIKGRPKSIHSIWNKMKSQNVSFEEVYDLFAIRIILRSDINNEKSVCWNVYSIITDLYKPNPSRLRDWISSPKISGYESLHTTVLGPENKWVEVQIRTERMDEIAEKGQAAHWRYKSGKKVSNDAWLARIRELLENPQLSDVQRNNDKLNLYSDEILVFTPEGDLKSLKKNYTILDFAYQIHSKVGDTCAGAIVNDVIQPLSYELQSGDTVKIITNKSKQPNQEWLKIAKGSKTKNKIKRALKTITYKHAQSGKELIKEKLDRLKIGFTEKNIELLSEYFKVKDTIEFYHKIGEGTIDISKIKLAFEKDQNQEKEVKDKKIDKIFEQEVIQTSDFLLIDENISDLDYKLAKCCNPLPGDEIFGFVTVNKGTKIHKKKCPNASDMKSRYPYRIVKAKWNVKDSDFGFSITLFVSGYDKKGISGNITDVITQEFNLKLHALNFKIVKDDQFEGTVVVKINNKKQLLDLINRLKLIKGVKTVSEK